MVRLLLGSLAKRRQRVGGVMVVSGSRKRGAVDNLERLSTVSTELSTLLQSCDSLPYQVGMTPNHGSSPYTDPVGKSRPN